MKNFINLAGESFNPKWVSIEEKLPMMLAEDFMTGTEYRVRYKDGTEGTSFVCDHNTWYHHAIEFGITHWFETLNKQKNE